MKQQQLKEIDHCPQSNSISFQLYNEDICKEEEEEEEVNMFRFDRVTGIMSLKKHI